MPNLPPKHRPPGWRPTPKFRSPAQAFYHTQAWRNLADSVRERDQGICRNCGAPDSRRVDHIRPRAEGGADAEWNLQLLCNDCDARKHAEKGKAWR